MRQAFLSVSIALTTILLALSAVETRAATVWNESTNGDLSNNQAAPTTITLAQGTNSVIGNVGGTDTQDWLTFTIPAGAKLSSDVLAAYASTDVQGFTGVQAGTPFVGNPETTASAYLGYAHFGTNASNGPLTTTNLVGVDLLPIMGNPTFAAGSQGFTPPLGPGSYTFLIQQLGASTNYQFDFGLTPEPASLGLLGLATMALLSRRRGSSSSGR